MHAKRDREVVVFLRKSTRHVLLFPRVHYMAGRSCPYGDALQLTPPPNPTQLGRSLLRLFRECKKADLEAIKDQKLAEFERWRLTRGPWREAVPATWTRLLAEHPAIARGPGSFLRQFHVCSVFERDSLTHRKLIRVMPSQYRGCTTGGDSRQLPLDESPRRLGGMILEFLESGDGSG